jgi:molybdate transport system ATP-binding protein
MSIEVAVRQQYAGFALDVAFGVERNGITALFGPSGAGKTTVLNAIAGLLRPEDGRIAIGGRVVFDQAARVWIPPRERRIGYVFQDARLFPHLTVERNLRFGWRRSRSRMPENEVAKVIQMLGLVPLLQRKPVHLSGGEKARVALARALLAAPDVLLLDEPLAPLDATRKNEILPYFERLRDEAGLPLIYVSHSLDEVSRLAQEIVILKEGCVAASGPIFDVLTDLQFPDFNRASPYGAVIETFIASHIETSGLTVLEFAGGELLVPRMERTIGTRLRTHIRAEDVMIAREEPRAISANNVLFAAIDDLRESTPEHIDLRLLCGATPLIARITRASRTRLALEKGVHVFAIIKSVTVAPQIS